MRCPALTASLTSPERESTVAVLTLLVGGAIIMTVLRILDRA